ARFIHREVAMLEDRHAIERMQCQVSGLAHLRFEVPEGVGDVFMSEHQPPNLNKSAAWKSKYDRVRHGFSPGFGAAQRPAVRRLCEILCSGCGQRIRCQDSGKAPHLRWSRAACTL